MRQAIADQALTDQQNRDVVLGVLQHSQVRDLANRLGLNVTRAEAARVHARQRGTGEPGRTGAHGRDAVGRWESNDRDIGTTTLLLIIIIIILVS